MLEHGTTSKYTEGCRCDKCKIAKAEYAKTAAINRSKRTDLHFTHGTSNGYSNYGCRCPECRDAQLVRNAEIKSSNIEVVINRSPSVGSIEHRHGTNLRYRYGCRCEECVSAHQKVTENLKIRMTTERFPHGEAGYGYGCRCNTCLGTHREYTRIRRNKLLSKSDRKIRHEFLKNNPITSERVKFRDQTQQKIASRLRNRLRLALHGKCKVGSAVKDLGCSIEEFKKYLEDGFCDGMSWDNYGLGAGKWNIDHIVPLCLFDLTNREHLLIACHYTNMRPLWSMENVKRPRDGSDL